MNDMPTQDLYLSLLKKSLLNQLYLDNELRIQYLLECVAKNEQFDMAHFLDPFLYQATQARQLRKTRRLGWFDDPQINKIGYARTMLSEARLDNIEFCIKDVIANSVPGDLIECGVWRGGGCIFMRGVLEAMNEPQRCVWVADSFEGLPRPSREEDMELDLSKELYPHLAVSIEQVQTAFSDYELLDDRVRFLKGWFKDTLAGAAIEKLAVLRLDGDLYESTMDTLEALYSKVSPGGYVIIDDFFIPACKAAVHDFRKKMNISDPINKIDWTGVFWQKSTTQ